MPFEITEVLIQLGWESNRGSFSLLKWWAGVFLGVLALLKAVISDLKTNQQRTGSHIGVARSFMQYVSALFHNTVEQLNDLKCQIIVQATCDHWAIFTSYDFGWPGSVQGEMMVRLEQEVILPPYLC